MGIRSKLFIVTGPLMLVMVFFVYSVVSDRFLAQFASIESDFAQENTDRALDALSGTLDDVDAKLVDWSQWDDTYAFVQDHNPEYVQSNLSSDATLQGTKLHMMVFTDTAGSVVATKNIADGDGASDALPSHLIDDLREDGFIGHSEKDVPLKGIVESEGRVLMVASRPIIRTDGTGPQMGTLVFVRLVDDALIGEISERIHLPLRLYTSLQDLPISDEQRRILIETKNKGENDVIVTEEDVVAGYGVVRSASDSRTLFIRIEMPRTIYAQGQGIIRFFNGFFGAVFVIFSLILVILFEWLIFNPISRLSADVDRIRSGGDDLRVQVKGNDEFSNLGNGINLMIESLHKIRQQKEESESRFQTVADLAPVMIWMAGIDKKCTYFNKRWLEFTGKRFEDELGDGWANGVHPDDLERCVRIYHSAFDARRAFRMEYRLKSADGRYRWILDNGIPNFAPDGTFVGYLGSCVDITDNKEIEEKNNERIEDMEALNKTMVSRELKMIELKEEIRKLKNDLSEAGIKEV